MLFETSVPLSFLAVMLGLPISIIAAAFLLARRSGG